MPPQQSPRPDIPVVTRTVFTDTERLADHMRRENDVLTNLHAAQERRVDQLVEAVGRISGDVSRLEESTSRMSDSMADLAESMKLLLRLDLQAQHDRQALVQVRSEIDSLQKRLAAVEIQMPGLIERSKWVTNGLLFVVGAVGVALLAVVVGVKGG